MTTSKLRLATKYLRNVLLLDNTTMLRVYEKKKNTFANNCH